MEKKLTDSEVQGVIDFLEKSHVPAKRGRPPISDKSVTVGVFVKMSYLDKVFYTKVARDKGMTLAGYIRHCVKEQTRKVINE